MTFKMVDMLEQPKEQENYAQPVPVAAEPPKARYPWGLEITLDEVTMEKLGIEEMPEPDSMIHGMFMAKVTGFNVSATGDKQCKNLRLQITHLALEDEDTEYQYSKKLYDHGGGEDEDE